MKKLIFILLAAFFTFLSPLLLLPQQDATRKIATEEIKIYNEITRSIGLSNRITNNHYTIKQYLGYKNNEELFKDKNIDNIFYSVYSSFKSFLGNYREALQDYALSQKLSKSGITGNDSLYISGLIKTDAVETISRMADSVRIVMINEAHHMPRHRILTTQLLSLLYAKGYRYFCAETLDNSDSLRDENLNARKYPQIGTGFYTLEPLYGDLIRQAIKTGYKVVPYEIPNNSKGDREVIEAENIYEIFKQDPNAKVIVHCGYSHITPSWMAGEFKRISGIRPLTIDQTEMAEEYSQEYCNEYYQAACKMNVIDKPSVFIDSTGKTSLTYGKLYDVIVFNPITKYVNGRPDWMAMDGYRRIYSLSAFDMKDVKFVQAIYSNEDTELAIPVDQIIVNNDNPVLYLPAGSYVLKFYDDKGNVISRRDINTE
ncbi:MAG: hypothetical protein LWX07_01090 [Bacteroidetes bacterium]|nr:hypothetical protein [Bacteroidota bacterium]